MSLKEHMGPRLQSLMRSIGKTKWEALCKAAQEVEAYEDLQKSLDEKGGEMQDLHTRILDQTTALQSGEGDKNEKVKKALQLCHDEDKITPSISPLPGATAKAVWPPSNGSRCPWHSGCSEGWSRYFSHKGIGCPNGSLSPCWNP